MLPLVAASVTLASPTSPSTCQARSNAQPPRVIELYTSEGCSSCPPADRWLTGLKKDKSYDGAVIQSFHVSYWDDLGWLDRFAKPEFNTRQRQIAAWNRSRSVYTPQIVENGRDAPLRRIFSGSAPTTSSRSTVEVNIRAEGGNVYVAEVSPTDTKQNWAAYWTVTEDGHSSKVRAGENRGEFLQHDFVVRQYSAVATQRGATRLQFDAGAADPTHPRRINFVVFSPDDGRPLQAIPLTC
jgi:hypothetical protein